MRVTKTDMPSAFGRATIVRITPHHLQHSNPVYFNGGYGVNDASFMSYLALRHGFDTFTIAYEEPRQRDDFYWLLSHDGDPIRRVHRHAVQRHGSRMTSAIIAEGQMLLARDIADAVDALGFTQIDAIGQSAGAMRMLEFTRKMPGKVGSLVLPYPAGIIKPNRGQIMRKAVRFATNTAKARKLPRERSIYDFIEPHMVPRIVRPKDTLATGDNILLSHHDIKGTSYRRNDLPRITLIAGLLDDLFSPTRLLAHVGAGIAAMHIVPGLHGFRERAGIVDLTAQILKDLPKLEHAPFQLHLPKGISEGEAQLLTSLAENVRRS